MGKIKILILLLFLGNSLLLPDPRIQAFDIKGDYLYLSNATSNLRIYDISDITNIQKVGGYVAPNNIITVQVVGDRLYLDVSNTGLLILDISNPLNPVQIGSFPDSYNSNYYLVKDSVAFTTTSAGLTLINVKNLPTPNVITSYNFSYSSFDVRGSVLGISAAGASSQFMVYSINDILNPVLKSTVTAGGYSCGPVYINGNYLVIVTLNVSYHYSSTGATLYDITDISNLIYETGLIGSGGYTSGSCDQFDIYKGKFFYGWEGPSYQGGWNYGSVKAINLNNHNELQTISEGTSYGQVKVDTIHSFLFLYNGSGEMDIYSINYYDGTLLLQNSFLTDIKNSSVSVVPQYSLAQNYPNPFNPTTVIRYSVPFESNLKLTVFNITGEQVNQLVNKIESPGTHEVNFTANNLPSGIYFYTMEATSTDGKQNFRNTKKFILLK